MKLIVRWSVIGHLCALFRQSNHDITRAQARCRYTTVKGTFKADSFGNMYIATVKHCMCMNHNHLQTIYIYSYARIHLLITNVLSLSHKMLSTSTYQLD